MTGDPHGRTARTATLLVRATDKILGTHSVKSSWMPGARRALNPRERRPAGQRLNRADTCLIVKSQRGALSRGHFNGLAGPAVVV
jgi:hypothetical protein